MRCLEVEAFLENLGADGYNHDNVSPQTPGKIHYNCLAWAAGKTDRPWWPSKEQPYVYYWPPHLLREEYRRETIGNFIKAFEWLGYRECISPDLEIGIEKIAVFAQSSVPSHAARQLESGAWTSKCGVRYEDIEHYTLHHVEGQYYGKAVVFMKRERNRKLGDALDSGLSQ
jgi:hypothetical protein